MLKSKVIAVLVIGLCYSTTAQRDSMTTQLPFDTIGIYPDTLTPATMLARSIEGLGFRYYWATAGLEVVDYNFTSGNGNRTSREIMEHLLGLSDMICNVVLGKPNIRPRPNTKKSDFVRRRTTLHNLKRAADYLMANPDLNLEARPIIFQRGENISDLPHWHLYNGPLADAIWHCGQIVSNRRASGNPINPSVSVFMGTKD